MADLSTLFCGFNPKRVFNGYLFGGVGSIVVSITMKRMHSTPAPMNWNISGKKASFLSPDVLAWVVTFAWMTAWPSISKLTPTLYPTSSTQRRQEMLTGSSMLSLVWILNSVKAIRKLNLYIMRQNCSSGTTEACSRGRTATAEERSCSTANETGYLLCFELSQKIQDDQSQK